MGGVSSCPFPAPADSERSPGFLLGFSGPDLSISKCTVLHIATHNLLNALIESGVTVVFDGGNLVVIELASC
ncbi:hypothetical protein J6590_003736 [Homalodisca vitripennis]|nr:hypothetical protein J6590_003736 [Homalodisca vitripennis]